MKIYVISRYEDNDKRYKEDFEYYEKPVSCFGNLKDAESYIENLSTSDVLGKGRENWLVKEDEVITYHIYNPVLASRAFHAVDLILTSPEHGFYRKSANFVYSIYEVELNPGIKEFESELERVIDRVTE